MMHYINKVSSYYVKNLILRLFRNKKIEENLIKKYLLKICLLIFLPLTVYYAYLPIYIVKKRLPNGDFYLYFEHKSYLKHFVTKSQKNLKTHVLSYTFFGKKWNVYGKHIESVAKEAANDKLYNNWTVRVYHDKDSINPTNLKSLSMQYDNIEFINVSNFANLDNINGEVWRFLTLADSSVDVTCIRDLDSKLISRDSDSVQVWLKSSKLVHIMRDQPSHFSLIMGGMWCYRNEHNRKLGFKIAKLCTENTRIRDPINNVEAMKGDDQIVLNSFVWPLIYQNALIHDSFWCEKNINVTPFPTKRNDCGEFVGQRREEVGIPKSCPDKCRPKDHLDWKYC